MGTTKTFAKRRPTLYIKNPRAHRLAEQVSKRLGVTLSDAVITAQIARAADNGLLKTAAD